MPAPDFDSGPTDYKKAANDWITQLRDNPALLRADQAENLSRV